MTTSTADPNTQVVKVEETGPASRRLVITLPAPMVDERLERSFATLKVDAAIPGFRKGRVPRELLERRFGDAILKEARGQLISEAYARALEDTGLRPVGEPEISPEAAEAELARGKPFSFALDIEVIPEFELPALDGISVRRPVIEVTDEHLDQEILRQRYRWGTPQRIDGPFERLDRMIGRAEVQLEGHDGIFFETDEALVVVPAEEDEGKGQFLGLLIEDLEKSLLGKKVGDTITLTTVGPAHHEREEIRGKKITITYAIRAAERITPADVTAIVERFGLGTEELLREQVRFALEQRRDAEQAGAQHEQIFEWLLEHTTFELPKKMSERQMTRTLARHRMDLLSRGFPEEEVEKRLAELRASSEEQVGNRLRLFFVLAKLAEQFGVQVTEHEVNGRIHQIAQSQGRRPDQIRASLQKSGGLNDVVVQIREQKVAARILENARVSDVSAEEWNREVESRAAAKRDGASKARSRGAKEK